jgi:hypothetical protein
MKNLKQIRPIISGAFLLSALMLLSGCGEWFGKKGGGCPTCEPSGVEGAAPADVLLSCDGKPVITKAKLDDFFEVYLRSRQDGMYAAMDPQAKRHAFNELVQMEVLKHHVRKNKLDQDPKYKKSFERAYDLALYTVNAEILGNQVLDSIDVSDPSLEKFYKESLGKNPAFDNAPFLKTPEGIKMKIVQFNDEKSANDFLAKAEKAGSDFSALAKAVKKDVRDLGMITAQTVFPQDIQKSLKSAAYSIKGKAKTIQPNATELVTVPGGPFVVVRASGPRQAVVYAEWAEVLKAQPDFKEKLANYKKQVEGQSEFLKRIEEWKKELNCVENTKFFEEEEARKKAELEAKFKELQEAQAKEETPEHAKAAEPAVKSEAAKAA